MRPVWEAAWRLPATRYTPWTGPTTLFASHRSAASSCQPATTIVPMHWDGSGARRSSGAGGFQFGDEFFSDQSFQYRMWPRVLGGGVPAFLFAVIESNLTAQGRSAIAGASDPNSGGTRWDLGLGLQYVTANYIHVVSVPIRARGGRRPRHAASGARMGTAGGC